MHRPRSLVAAFSLTVALSPGIAPAHPQFAAGTINRYARLVLHDASALRLGYTLMIGDAPGLELRTRYDADRNGILSPDEQQALASALAEAVRTSVHLALGKEGAPLSLRWQSQPALALATADTGTNRNEPSSHAPPKTAFSVELEASATLPLAAGAASAERRLALRFEDRVALPPEGEIELRIEEGPGISVRSVSGPGDATLYKKLARPLIFQVYGPPLSSLSDRSYQIEATLAEQKPAHRSTSWLFFSPVLVILLAIAARRHSRRSAIS